MLEEGEREEEGGEGGKEEGECEGEIENRGRTPGEYNSGSGRHVSLK